MSDAENDEGTTSREEEQLTYEIFFLVVRTICEKGVVKISDLRKVYQTAVSRDKSIQFRPLQAVLNNVNESLLHFQGWKATLQEDRLTYINNVDKEPVGHDGPNETDRCLGVLRNALMYVFMATRPNAKYPGVPHDDLMTYLETSTSTTADRKLSISDMELIKKQIAPNPRADFIKKGYLSFAKTINENDEEVPRYEWGPIANQTVDPTELVQIFGKLTGMAPNQLKEQSERAQALRMEQLKAARRGAVLSGRHK